MAAIPDQQILEILTHDGRALADWSLVRWPDAESLMPLAWSPVHGPLACVIEQDGEAAALVAYLIRQGARQFSSRAELLAAAKKEQWPSWERFCG